MDTNTVALQREFVVDVLDEIKPLLEKHYEEIAWRKDKIHLDPNYEAYSLLERRNMLFVFTARFAGELVGYAVWMVSQNLHYKSVKAAKNDIFYVEPTRRGAMIGKRLITFSEAELKKQGCNVISLHIKKSHNWQGLAEHLGYEHTELNMQKWIGG